MTNKEKLLEAAGFENESQALVKAFERGIEWCSYCPVEEDGKCSGKECAEEIKKYLEEDKNDMEELEQIVHCNVYENAKLIKTILDRDIDGETPNIKELLGKRTMKLKFTLEAGAYAPERAHETDAGADLRTRKAFSIAPYDSAVIDTGVHIEIPKGYMGQVCSKSGLNVKKNVVVPNGTVDSGYTGSIVVKIYNLGFVSRQFNAGDKVAQIIIQPVECCEFEQVDSLDETERGNNGFGSTGR